MLREEDMPWLDYLMIDEETFERVLRDDTPEDIRQKYIEFLREREE